MRELHVVAGSEPYDRHRFGLRHSGQQQIRESEKEILIGACAADDFRQVHQDFHLPVGVTKADLPKRLRIERHFLHRYFGRRGQLNSWTHQMKQRRAKHELVATAQLTAIDDLTGMDQRIRRFSKPLDLHPSVDHSDADMSSRDRRVPGNDQIRFRTATQNKTLTTGQCVLQTLPWFRTFGEKFKLGHRKESPGVYP